MNDTKPALYVIDDDQAVIEGLERLLNVAGYDTVTFTSAEAFLDRLDTVPPDALILTDVCMPGLDGIDLIKRLNAGGHTFPVIVMTGQASVPMAINAMRAGATDFVEKPFARTELFEALDRARSRRKPPGDTQAVPAELSEQIESLSPREREVMQLMIAGEPSKVIARRLGISPRTVEIHRSHILRKMDARNLADLIHKTARLGISPSV